MPNFYPRSPCGERRTVLKSGFEDAAFLSTLSLRRATAKSLPHCFAFSDFYPRSPCGERLVQLVTQDQQQRFLSTLSLRRATGLVDHVIQGLAISIHALLAESDKCTPWNSPTLCYFYPRSPCGERPGERASIKPIFSISIHALLAESDTGTLDPKKYDRNFYPRSPCGERQRYFLVL